MGVIVPDQPSDELVFLYKLKKGISSHSFGVECAHSAGFPDSTCQRAKSISECILNRRVRFWLNNSNNFEFCCKKLIPKVTNLDEREEKLLRLVQQLSVLSVENEVHKKSFISELESLFS